MGGRCLAFVLLFALSVYGQISPLMDFRFESAGADTLNYQRWIDRTGKYEAWNGLYAHPDKYDATWVANRAGLYFSTATNSKILRVVSVPPYDSDATTKSLAPLLYQNFTFAFWIRMDGSTLGDGNKLLARTTRDLTNADGSTELISLEQTSSDVLRLKLAFMQYDGTYLDGKAVTTTTTIGGSQTWDRWFHLAVVVRYSWEPTPVTRGFIYIDGTLRSPKYYESGSQLSPDSSSIIQYYRDVDALMTIGAKIGANWTPSNGLNKVIVARYQVYAAALTDTEVAGLVYLFSDGKCVGDANLSPTTEARTKCRSCPPPDSGSGAGQCHFEKCSVGQFLSSLRTCTACSNTAGTCTNNKDYLSCPASGTAKLDGAAQCDSCSSCCDTCSTSTDTCYGCHLPTATSMRYATNSGRYGCYTETHLKAGTEVLALTSLPSSLAWSVLFWARLTDYTAPGRILDLGSYTYEDLILRKGTTNLIDTSGKLTLKITTSRWTHFAFTGNSNGHKFFMYDLYPDYGTDPEDETNTTPAISLTKLTICYKDAATGKCKATVKGVQIWSIAMTRAQIEDSQFMIWEKPRSGLVYMLPLNEGPSRSLFSSVGQLTADDWVSTCDTDTLYQFNADMDAGPVGNVMLCRESSNPIQPILRYNEDYEASCPYRYRWVFNQVCYGDTVADTEHGTLLMRGNSTSYAYNKPYALNTNAGIYFDGVDDMLTLPPFPGSGPRFEMLSAFSYFVWIYPQDKNFAYRTDGSDTDSFIVEDYTMGLVSIAYSSGQPARAFYIGKDRQLYIESWTRELAPTGQKTQWTTFGTGTNFQVEYNKWQLVGIAGSFPTKTASSMKVMMYRNRAYASLAESNYQYFDLNNLITPEDSMIAGAIHDGAGLHSFFRGFMYELQIYNSLIAGPAPDKGHNSNWIYLESLVTQLTYPLSDRVDYVPAGMTRALSWQDNTGQDTCFPLECATRLPYCDRNECCTSCDSTSCLMGGKCITPPEGQFRHPVTSHCTFPLPPAQPLYARWRDFHSFADLWQPSASHVPSNMHRRYIFVLDMHLDLPVDTFEGFCSSFFTSATADSFGQGANCFFSNSTTITVYLGSAPTIVANDTLFLADGVFHRVNEAVRYFTTGASVTLQLPRNVVTAEATIAAPGRTSLCYGSLTLDSRHSWPMVNTRTYWSITGAVFENSPEHVLTLHPTTAGVITATLRVVNMFGSEDSVSTSIEVVEDPVPEASFPVTRLYISKDQGKVNVPVIVKRSCGSSSHRFTYKWSIVETTGEAEALYQKLSALSTALDLDPADLAPGTSVRFRVEVAEEKLPGNLGFAEILIISKQSDLRAVIRGGNRELFYMDDLQLSARSSFDPDVSSYANYQYDTAPMDESMRAMWECYYRDGDVTYPCGIREETRFSVADMSKPELTIPGGSLMPGLSYTFVLTVAKDTRKARTSVRVDVVEAARSNIWINPYFYGFLTSGSSANIVSSAWSAVGVDSASVIANDVQNRPFALLKFDSWPALARYQFVLETVDDIGFTGRAFITIENNALPRHGRLEITGAGMGYQDPFTLDMVDWFDEWLPLTYAFSRIGDSGSSFLISTQSLMSSMTTYLPSSSGSIVGTVSNALGASTSATQPVAVSSSNAMDATKNPIPAITNRADELLSLFSLYCELFQETQVPHVLSWALDIAGQLLETPSCEITRSITQHAILVGLSDAGYLSVFTSALKADQSFGCVDISAAFDMLTAALTPGQVTQLVPYLGKSALSWAVPLGAPVELSTSGLVVSFSRSWWVDQKSVDTKLVSTDPAFAQAGATITKSGNRPGCLDVVTMASYDELNSQPIHNLELRDTGYSSVQVSILDLSLAYGCQVNKFGEVEFDGFPVWNRNPLVASEDLTVSYLTYHLPFRNPHEEAAGVVRCVQWNGEFWTEAYCEPGDLRSLNVSTLDCTCSQLLPTTARVVQPYTRFDVDLPMFERVPYRTMFERFNPIHILIILGCLTGVAAVLAVYADQEGKKNPPVTSCLSYYKEESLYASVVYAYKVEYSRLSRVTLIAVKWFFMLYILGIWYYHQREELRTEYYQADAGMAGVVVVLAFIVHLIFLQLLNSARMSPCICIGYVLAMVFIGSAIIVAFAITRRNPPHINGLWVISYLSALAMEVLVADPCIVGLKAAIDSVNKK